MVEGITESLHQATGSVRNRYWVHPDGNPLGRGERIVQRHTHRHGGLTMRKARLATLAVMPLVAFGLAAGPATAGGAPLSTTLLGANEVLANGSPAPSDPDGFGTARITVNPGRGEVCWNVTAQNLSTVVGVHIHEAPSTTTGGVVVHLTLGSGCTEVSRELALDLLRNSEEYYVNVHTDEFPGGAIRGQLG
jgi:hypothetical protein